MRARILTLPAAAVVIASLCTWKVSQPEKSRPAITAGTLRQVAPRFELYDQHSRLVKFERYLGRHLILLAFVDRPASQANQWLLDMLQRHGRALSANGVVVIAVSGRLPQEIRKLGEFTFPVLTDINPTVPGFDYLVHRQWGQFDGRTGQPASGVFLIDRSGYVTWSGDAPRPETDPERAVAKLIGGGAGGRKPVQR